jgi:glutamate N-acetyltransferase / amino-acid N-acetyltransferase
MATVRLLVSELVTNAVVHAGTEVALTVRLGLGDGTATAWGCELTEGYVQFNSAYTT